MPSTIQPPSLTEVASLPVHVLLEAGFARWKEDQLILDTFAICEERAKHPAFLRCWYDERTQFVS